MTHAFFYPLSFLMGLCLPAYIFWAKSYQSNLRKELEKELNLLYKILPLNGVDNHIPIRSQSLEPEMVAKEMKITWKVYSLTCDKAERHTWTFMGKMKRK